MPNNSRTDFTAFSRISLITHAFSIQTFAVRIAIRIIAMIMRNVTLGSFPARRATAGAFCVLTVSGAQ